MGDMTQDQPYGSSANMQHLIAFITSFQIPNTLETNHDHTQSQIQAKNDYQAIQCWLNEYQHKATTLRTYQKEAERFLLWCMIQKRKPLFQINRDDIEQYSDFLDNPAPKELWCGKKNGRGQKRGSASWRPFTGPLNTATKMTALSILESLFTYLTDARYLSFNPFSLIRKRKFNRNHQEVVFKIQERILEIDEWHSLLDTLKNLPDEQLNEKHEKQRLQFLVTVLYFLGLRINELATHSWNAFRKIDDKWWFYVLGKGDKLAKIPVNDTLLRAIIEYRAFLKLPPLPKIDDVTPIVSTMDNLQKPISARHMNKLLKKLALATAKKYLHQPEKANKLKKFSAHWLRHLSASMQDRAGISFKHIRSNLRHENDDTTRLYVHAMDDERHDDMQKLQFRLIDN